MLDNTRNKLFGTKHWTEINDQSTGVYNTQCQDWWQKLFDQPTNNDIKTYENIRKITAGQGYDCTTGCLLVSSYFKINYKMIAIDLIKQQTLDADPRTIEQINFSANLDRAGNTTMLFIIEKAKKLS